jgi:radical SAM superfamily enzyme YgiQ (UPF0313 family)
MSDNFSNKIRVHLLLAPSIVRSRYEALNENVWPPVGILYLASYLRPRINNVEIKVTNGAMIGYEDTIEAIKNSKPDIIGISFSTPTAYGAARLAREARQAFPNAWIVMGGAHATALPEDTLKMSGADLVVMGEGEETFYHIVRLRKEGRNKIDLSKLAGICLEIDGTVHKNDPAEFITPIDSIPFPAWDLIDIRDYRGFYLSKQWPEVPMLFSRGCPYNCTFCPNCVWKSSKPVVRLRSPENIADEIEYLQRAFSVKEIFDTSDEFNCNLGHSLDICREIKKRDLGITWKTQLRVTPFTEELAREMAEAGCWYVHLGIESGNQATLDGIRKHIRLEDVEPTCRLLKKYGIKILALFMLFNVWEKDGTLMFEDAKTTQNTLKFARELTRKRLIDYLGWSITTPYPGSRLYDIALRHNIVNPTFLSNWEAWQQEGLFMMDLPGVSRKDRGSVKLKGDLLRGMLVLKNRDLRLKHVSFLIKRAIHIFKYSFK